jgi:hypothetical protein
MHRNEEKTFFSVRRVLTRAILGTAALFLVSGTPISTGVAPPAQAQFRSGTIHGQAGIRMHGEARAAAQFYDALAPYGQWRHSSRWGDVWAPQVTPDWRPYTVGRWIYTDDWGWYWVAGDPEVQWGWVVYHYGRWVFDADLGWIWIPDDTWGPAWVMWRQGAEQLGWAPLPPEPLLVEYREEPDVWIFVQAQEFFAPDIASVLLPANQITVAFRNTVVVNQSLVVDGGFAVNPGIEPAIIAASAGHAVKTYQVRPVVLAGTAAVPNAIQAGPQQFRQARQLQRQSIRVTQNQIRPAAQITKPIPLAKNERGRLGQQPPRFAQGARPATNLPQNVQRQGTSIQAPPGRQPNQTPTAQPGPNQRLDGTQQGLTPEQRNQQQHQQAAQRAQQQAAQRAQQQAAQRAQQQQAAQRAQQQQAQRAQQQQAQRAQQQQAAQRAQQQQAAQRAQQHQAAQRAQQQAQRGQLQGLYGQVHGPPAVPRRMHRAQLHTAPRLLRDRGRVETRTPEASGSTTSCLAPGQ